MNPETKKNATVGVSMTVPIVITKKQINQETQVEDVIEIDSEEIITLRPVPIKYWAELEELDIFNFQIPLIMYTCRKSRRWVEDVLSPNYFDTLYKKCEEMNTSFFARQELILTAMERNAKIKEKADAIIKKREKEEDQMTRTEQSNP